MGEHLGEEPTSMAHADIPVQGLQHLPCPLVRLSIHPTMFHYGGCNQTQACSTTKHKLKPDEQSSNWKEGVVKAQAEPVMALSETSLATWAHRALLN